MKCKRTDHITSILRQLHRLPIQKRICHKIMSATGQFMIVTPPPPPTYLIFSIDTSLLAFSDQHLDLSMMFPGPGIPRQSLLLDALGEDIQEGGSDIPEGSLAAPLCLGIPGPGNIMDYSVFPIFAENSFLYLGYAFLSSAWKFADCVSVSY